MKKSYMQMMIVGDGVGLKIKLDMHAFSIQGGRGKLSTFIDGCMSNLWVKFRKDLN